MTNAQYEIATYNQYRVKALEKRMKKLESGEAYQELMDKLHAANARYDRMVKVKDRELRAAEAQAEKVRNIWFDEVLPDVVQGYEKKLAKERKRAEEAEEKCEHLQAQRDAYREKANTESKKRYAAETKLAAAEDEIKELRRRLNRNHRNSGTPTSQESVDIQSEPADVNVGESAAASETENDQVNAEVAEIPRADAAAQRGSHKRNGRTKSGAKPGAKKGHKGNRLQRVKATSTVDLRVPPEIGNSEDWVLTGEVVVRQVINARVVFDAVDYRAAQFRNVHTGRLYLPEFPADARTDVNYGTELRTLILYMMHSLHVSENKIRTFLSEATDGKLNVSAGMISSVPLMFSGKTEADRELIFNALKDAPWVGVDWTSVKVNGKSGCIGTCANNSHVYYAYTAHKGHEAAKALPIAEYDGTIVGDCESTTSNYGTAWQICLAHILRELTESLENEPNVTWSTEMKAFMQGLIHQCKEVLEEIPEELKDRLEMMSEDEIKEIEDRYLEIIALGKDEYEYEPPTWYTKGKKLLERLERRAEDALHFLHYRDVPWTNNLCERVLRIWVRRRRQAISFRSEKHVQACCHYLTFVETRRRHGRNVFQDISDAFRGTLTPLESSSAASS